MHRLRAVPLALLALLALGLLAGPAGAASPKPKPCAKGKVRLVAGNGCVAVKGAKAALPAKARAEARLRKVAGPRALRQARAMARALDAAVRAPKPAARAARARAHAADVVDAHDGQWHDIDVDGAPGRQRTTEVVHEGASPSQTITIEGQVVKKVDGATITATTTTTRTITFDACPDAAGVAHGSIEIRKIERVDVVRGTERAFTETRSGERAIATTHNGDDAKIADATYDGLLDFEVRGTGAPSKRYIMTWTASAPTPSGPPAGFEQAFARDPAAALAGNWRGPKGARLTDAELQGLVVYRAGMQPLLENELKDVLLQMELSWTSIGRCLDVILDPPSASMAQGETKTFTATAKAKDGTPVGGALKAYALGADVSPNTATMEPGAAVKLDVTMGDKDSATFAVDVTSKRGVASVLIEIPKATGWDVTFTAKGSYAMQTDHHGDTDKAVADLSWTTTFHDIRFDGAQYNPFGQTTIGGTMAQNGTLGTGTYTCSGTPWVMKDYNSTITPTPVAGGAQRIRIVPFTAVVVDRPTEQCNRAGYGGDYGNIDGITSTVPYEAHLTVTPEQLASGDFTVPVHRDGDFAADCEVEAICSYNGDMSGTVHFQRR